MFRRTGSSFGQALRSYHIRGTASSLDQGYILVLRALKDHSMISWRCTNSQRAFGLSTASSHPACTPVLHTWWYFLTQCRVRCKSTWGSETFLIGHPSLAERAAIGSQSVGPKIPGLLDPGGLFVTLSRSNTPRHGRDGRDQDCRAALYASCSSPILGDTVAAERRLISRRIPSSGNSGHGPP